MSVINKIFKNRNNSDHCTAVIVAAGSSSRMGRDKILMPLGDKPVIAHTLLAFEGSDKIDEIIVVTKLESIQAVADICAEFGITKISKVMCGGKSRLESSIIGVLEADESAGIIAIHDGARPFPSKMLIDRLIDSVSNCGAVAPAVAPTDTVRLLNAKGAVAATPDRDLVALIQTPQVFDAQIIKSALIKAHEKRLTITDDCSAVEATGGKVCIVAGEQTNIKLTTAMDVYVAERILAERGNNA